MDEKAEIKNEEVPFIHVKKDENVLGDKEAVKRNIKINIVSLVVKVTYAR